MPSLSSIFAVVAGVLMLIIIVMSGFLYVDSGKIDTLNDRIAICQSNNKALDAETQVQNTQVDKLREDQDKLAIATAAAEKAAVKADKPISNQIDAFKDQKPVGDACTAANALYNSYIGVKK